MQLCIERKPSNRVYRKVISIRADHTKSILPLVVCTILCGYSSVMKCSEGSAVLQLVKSRYRGERIRVNDPFLLNVGATCNTIFTNSQLMQAVL